MEAVGERLIRGVEFTPTAAVIGLVPAAALVAIGVYTGYPIATAFTVTDAVIVVGLALGGDPAWTKYRKIAGLWIAVPFVGSGIAYGTARLLQAARVAESVTVPLLGGLVGAIVANMQFDFLGADTASS